jgi:hypothetical protein
MHNNREQLYSIAQTEATSLDWKSQCLENPSIPLLRLADKKSRIYRVRNIEKTVLVISKEF